MDGWMGGWPDRWTDDHTDEQTNQPINYDLTIWNHQQLEAANYLQKIQSVPLKTHDMKQMLLLERMGPRLTHSLFTLALKIVV